MISVLCGLFEATSGRAEIYGMELRDNISDIHMLTGKEIVLPPPPPGPQLHIHVSQIGVCPQHDVLWESMTGAEVSTPTSIGQN